MDSLTHVVLGATTGGLLLGRTLGRKALVYGGIVATIPDLDVVIGKFLDPVTELTLHRSITHSLLFVLLLAPLLGLLFARFQREVGWLRWSLFSLLCLLSAVLLDTFTTYGVQLGWPFIARDYALSTISVVDPLFTLPLLLAVIVALVRPPLRPLLAGALGFSLAYLGATVAAELHVRQVFTRSLAAHGLAPGRAFVKPTPLNAVLWRGIAETDDAFWVGFYSLLDADQELDLQRLPKHHDLLDRYAGGRATRALIEVTDGYFRLEPTADGIVLHDMRYGSGMEWLETPRDSVFAYRLRESDAGASFEVLTADRTQAAADTRLLWERIKGER